MRALHPSGVCVCCTPSHFSVKSVQDHCEVLTVSGSIWSVSDRASGGLIRPSSVSLFLDLCLLDFVYFFCRFFSSRFCVFFAVKRCLFSARWIGAAMPRPVSHSVVIGLHYVQAEQVEVPAMYSAVSGATVVPANSHSSRLPVFVFLFRFALLLLGSVWVRVQ